MFQTFFDSNQHLVEKNYVNCVQMTKISSFSGLSIVWLPLRFSLMFISNSGIHGNTVVDQNNKNRSDVTVCKHPIPFSDIKTFIL